MCIFFYCLKRSTTASTGFSLHRVSTIIGERAVGVLSTLIYLSYSKMLRNVIDILTYSTVHLPSGVTKVWFYDGNVEYLNGKHTVLFVVAMATSTLFYLPYTIALTFILSFCSTVNTTDCSTTYTRKPTRSNQ